MVCGAWYPLADQVGACPLETYRPTFPAFPIMQNTEIFHICWQDSLLSLPSTLILTTTTTTTTYGDIQSQLKTYLLKYPMILTDSLKSCSAPFSSASAVQQCNMISPNIPFTIINIILIAVHGLNPNFNTFHSITPSLLHITKINMQHFFVNSLLIITEWHSTALLLLDMIPEIHNTTRWLQFYLQTPYYYCVLGSCRTLIS